MSIKTVRNIFSFRPASRAGRLMALALLTAVAAGVQADVPIEQSPLIVQQALPPNVVLLLDDSGSMGRDYMPERGYMDDTSLDGLQSSAVNAMYYNPNVTYEPPKKADGSDYPAYTFPWVPDYGFRDPTDREFIESYDGSFDYWRWLYYKNADDCEAMGATDSTRHYGYCYSDDPNLSGTLAFQDPDNGVYYYYGDGYYDGWRRVFAYTVQTNNGYEERYITGSCDGLQNQPASRCDDSAAAQQNVANWFAYYRIRMQAAKSGLMNSFSDLESDFRVGFGSINGNQADEIVDMTNEQCGSTYSDSCRSHFSTQTNSNNEIAGVVEWGDGSSGSRKAQFWDWLEIGYSSGNTPLRETLEGAGIYYEKGQPWMSRDDNGDDHEYSCRQSYTILTSDGFWNRRDPGVGNVDGTDGATQGAESDGRILGPNGIEYLYDAELPYSDDESETLADVAMYYWKNDLRTGVDNRVPTTDEDPGFWQHMTTFTVGLGFDALDGNGNVIDTDAVFDWANGGAAISGFEWPTPSSGSINNIADMLHAAVNGHGGFYSAKNPQEFASAISDALGKAAERVGTGASLAANSTRLETGTVTYQATYKTGEWEGDLKAYPVDPTTGDISTNPNWLAADALLAAPLASCSASGDELCPNDRTIYTHDGDADPDDGYTEFVTGNINQLSSGQQSALGATATERENILQYLRGDSTNARNNGGAYRTRNTALGDIVDSQPVYVGAPDANLYTARTFTGVEDYSTFATDQQSRAPTIYVAANDGMLHGFDASTGTETYAYLPGAVIEAGLADIANPAYGGNPEHQFFNNGELTVADVYLPANGNNGDWATVLVGTTGVGPAKTVYALDVTDPANVEFLWERSADDGESGSDYIGQMAGKPLVIQTADGEWSVLMGNGYNSDQGRAALLEFDVDDGDLTVYETDTNTDNGLAAPATFDYESAPDGIQDIAFAGDLNGRVWEFDLDSGTVTERYQALDANDDPQPITAALLLGKDPNTAELWTFFGTGKFLANEDIPDPTSSVDPQTQTWYGLVVKSTAGGREVTASDDRSELIERDIIDEAAPSGSSIGTRVFSKGVAGDIASKSGWYMDLVSPTNGAEGERMVAPNQFQGSVLIGTSIVPEAVDVCNPSGRGFIMALDPFDGTNVDKPFFDINGDGVVDGNDVVTVGDETYAAGGLAFSRMPNPPIFVGNTMLTSFDDGSTASIQTSGGGLGSERQSWREIVGE